MAIYIELLKVAETESEATYDYYPEGNRDDGGKLLVVKETGEIRKVLSSPIDKNEFYYLRAARKVWIHHEKGEYPQRTCWAS